MGANTAEPSSDVNGGNASVFAGDKERKRDGESSAKLYLNMRE